MVRSNRALSCICILLAPLFGVSFAQPAADIAWRSKVSGPGYLLGTIVMPSGQINARAVANIGSRALERYPEYQMIHIEIYSQEDYPPIHYLGMYDGGYEWWWFRYQKWSPHPIGRIVKLGRGTIAEYSDGHASISRKLLSGGDPLDITTAHHNCRLRYLIFHRIPLGTKIGRGECSLEVCATTDSSLAASVGRELLDYLRSVVPFKELNVRLRNDLWFLDVQGFPIQYPFDMTQTPPTKQEFLALSSLLCGGLNPQEDHCQIFPGRE